MVAEREEQIRAFLKRAGWARATRLPLAGDASNRRYERLLEGPGGSRAVLMDASPARGENVTPFLQIGRHLRHMGLSAPKIFAEDVTHGLLLLEDFGDDLYASLLTTRPELETEIYRSAVDVLIALYHHAPPGDIPNYEPATMTALAGLAFNWYAGASQAEFAPYSAELETILHECALNNPVLALRDFHAENLIWLPARKGVARVGLLDFQDAACGPAVYDLVSLTEDARRDVPPALEEDMLRYYATGTGQDMDRLRLAAAITAAQRNLRILGVFARLSLHFGKPGYVDFIPRVWAHLMRDLAHPRLARLRGQVLATLPAPTRTHLDDLRARCGTIPTL